MKKKIKTWVVHIDIHSMVPEMKEGTISRSSTDWGKAKTNLENILGESIYNVKQMYIDAVGYDDLTIFFKEPVTEIFIKGFVDYLNTKIPQASKEYYDDYLVELEKDGIKPWNCNGSEYDAEWLDDTQEVIYLDTITGRFIV